MARPVGCFCKHGLSAVPCRALPACVGAGASSHVLILILGKDFVGAGASNNPMVGFVELPKVLFDAIFPAIMDIFDVKSWMNWYIYDNL